MLKEKLGLTTGVGEGGIGGSGGQVGAGGSGGFGGGLGQDAAPLLTTMVTHEEGW
ncbi:MAG TPA: hypothetical protein VFX73_02270 [Chitinophagaceae bacterium]|nr:hypothetical protein [Chitinophagaceae bacterium]